MAPPPIRKRGPARSSSISKSKAEREDASFWAYSEKLCPRRWKISVPSAPEKRGWARKESPFITRDRLSTVSFPTSCFRAVISLMEMEGVAKVFTEKNLQTRTLSSNMRDHSTFPWRILVPIPTDLNSSSPLSKPHGLTDVTLSLERSSRERMLSSVLRV